MTLRLISISPASFLTNSPSVSYRGNSVNPSIATFVPRHASTDGTTITVIWLNRRSGPVRGISNRTVSSVPNPLRPENPGSLEATG